MVKHCSNKSTCKRQLFNEKFSERDIRIIKRNLKKESNNNILNKFKIDRLQNELDYYKQYSESVYNHYNNLHNCYIDIVNYINNNSIYIHSQYNYLQEPQIKNDIYSDNKAYDNLSNCY